MPMWSCACVCDTDDCDDGGDSDGDDTYENRDEDDENDFLHLTFLPSKSVIQVEALDAAQAEAAVIALIKLPAAAMERARTNKTTTAHCSVPMLETSKRWGGPISLMVLCRASHHHHHPPPRAHLLDGAVPS